MRRAFFPTLVLLGILSSGAASLAQAAKAEDPWAPLAFLLGEWKGTGSGKPGEATSGRASFAFDLDKNVMVRHNRAEYAPKPGDTKPVVHTDLMVIYREAGDGGFRAIYFDSEGHVINYVLSLPGGGTSAIFESEGGDKGPRFKLTYELQADKSLTVDFAVAPPGGEFKSYVKGVMKRAR